MAASRSGQEPQHQELENYVKAILNIMEDFAAEKERLENSQHAVINILDDFSDEKARLEETQRAMLNLLEDFAEERAKSEAARGELQLSFDSLRAAKESAEAATQEIESFSYSVSHDLRAPLRSLSGFSKLLLTDYRDRLDETGRDYLSRIAAAAERMGMLIDDLLKLSRVSRAVMEVKEVDLGAIAGRVIAQIAVTQPERRVESIMEESIAAFGDERLLAIALENLLRNAWKFTNKKESAVIEFGVKDRGEGERVYFVSDNGAGFDMDYVNKLFNPFQRLHQAEEFPGTGIGLATSKRIIDRHGGHIWIEGAVGKGACVYFTLQGKE